MPPRKRTTRSSAATTAGSRQTPLNFGTSKVTKPGTTTAVGKPSISHSKKAVSEAATLSNRSTPLREDAKAVPATDEVHSEDSSRHETPEASAELSLASAIKATADAAGAAPKINQDEEKAKNVSEAQIKKYWKAKEDLRITPRVHQKGLSIYEKVLREFDLSSQFGSCIGIPRTTRWHRAQKLGLSPPIEVLAVLVRELEQEQESKKKGKRLSGGSDDGRANSIQVAYVDELMGAKGLVEEVR